MSDRLDQIEASCPRCGYDQRGVLATWGDTSPLEGTCTECGLRFDWGELLGRRRGIPRWCVEYRRSAIRTPLQVVSTLVRSYWPWRFWSAIRMSHDVQWSRLALYLFLLAFALYTVLAFSHAWMVWSAWYATASSPQVTASTSGTAVFLQALALPLSSDSIGSFTIKKQPLYPYATPLQYARNVWFEAVPFLAIFFAQHAFMALTFALLPVSRRKAKVRWRHIIRVALYGYGLFVIPLALSIVATSLLEVTTFGGEQVAMLAGAAWLALPVLEVAWWSVATGRFLHMEHAWGVGLAVVVMGILIAPVVLALISYAS